MKEFLRRIGILWTALAIIWTMLGLAYSPAMPLALVCAGLVAATAPWLGGKWYVNAASGIVGVGWLMVLTILNTHGDAPFILIATAALAAVVVVVGWLSDSFRR